MTSSANKPVEDAPVIERDERSHTARQARVSEKTASALKPPGPIPASPPASGLSAVRQVGPTSPKRGPAEAGGSAGGPPPLLGKAAADRYRKKMRDALAGFVDDPGDAVAGADTLLGEAIDELTEALRKRREEMSRQRQGNASDTEQLRQSLLRYRTLLDWVVTQ
ncbi:hypothetical protein LO772_20385 [Yinghuangia sp. ASG 101]|uniref:hypothetical protein n=1 Tax=Yinghuangia sp. ASG 101 TaxID=2896848 RepID=UPI001E568B71|nr:hypothetical protein [Yinghuangia sp. ASG 101]UGQ09304.1 hypothetical protein LO772_20385 [Yinghuangia sp. ASG 101]